MSTGNNNELAKLKQFVVDNNIVGTSAGVCVALAAKDGIESLVGDVIIPIIIMLLHALHIESLSKFLPVKGSEKLNIPDFIKQMVTFILIIIISFVFVQFAFGYLLGIDSSNKDSSSTATDSATTADAIKNASMVDTTSSLAGASAGSGSGSNTSSTTSGSGSGSSTAVKEKFGNFGDHFSGVGGSSFASANF
jgi:large-conductance mechanosensitive channel